MRRNYVDLIEVKTPEEWEEYKTMLSITTLAVFETKEVGLFLLSFQAVRAIRIVREAGDGQKQRRFLLDHQP